MPANTGRSVNLQMSASHNNKATNPDPLLVSLFGEAKPTPVNTDLNKRVEIHSQDRTWKKTAIDSLSVCVLEHCFGENERMTALFKLDNNPDTECVVGADIPSTNLELLVQHGMVSDDDTEYLHPFYIRQPEDRFGINQTFTLYPGSQNKPQDENLIEFYVATGQLAASDTQRRCINLADHNLWLPGPVDNTQVMPLHMHNGNNSMLVRWQASISFKPRLDPLGEEVLVISGTLTDEHGTYAAGSWIRNPVKTWQAWSGSAGTLIYYKNGHFG